MVGASRPAFASGGIGAGAGAVVTFAGSGAYANTDGTGTGAAFAGPNGLALAGSTLYVTENSGEQSAIRAVNTSTAAVTTIMSSDGDFDGCGYADGSSPSVCYPTSPTSDGTNLYFLDAQLDSGTLREYTPGVGASTLITQEFDGLAWGANGDLYASTGSSLVQVNLSNDTTSTVLSSGGPFGALAAGPSGLWIISNGSMLFWAYGGSSTTSFASTGVYSAVSQAGNYVYAVLDSGEVVQFDVSSGCTSGCPWAIVAGNPTGGNVPGTGFNAWTGPTALAASSSGTVYLADAANLIKTLTAGTAPSTTVPPVANTVNIDPGIVEGVAGTATSGNSNGYGDNAEFDGISGVTDIGSTLVLLENDGENAAVREINTLTGQATTMFGTLGDYDGCSYADGDNANVASACYPYSAVNDGVFVYLSDYSTAGPSGIRRLNPTTGGVSTIIPISQTGGSTPADLAYGADGNLYAASNSTLYEINLSQDTASAVLTGLGGVDRLAAGTTGLWIGEGTSILHWNYGATGTTTFTSGTASLGAMVQAGQYLYVAENAESIWQYNVSGGPGTLIAGGQVNGSGQPVYGYENGIGTAAEFEGITGMTMDSSGRLWVADTTNVRVVVAGPAGAGLTSANLTANGNLAYLCTCQTGAETQTGSHPVNDETGEFWHTFGDLSVPGRGPGLDLTRTYSSSATSLATTGLFGPGWFWSYGMSLGVSGSTVTVTQENGSQVSFTQTGSTYTPTQLMTEATLTNSGGVWTFTRHATQIFTFNSSGQLISVSGWTAMPPR
jgi:uncharacterized protein DUF6531